MCVCVCVCVCVYVYIYMCVYIYIYIYIYIYKGQFVPQAITVASARKIFPSVPRREIIAVHFANLKEQMSTICQF